MTKPKEASGTSKVAHKKQQKDKEKEVECTPTKGKATEKTRKKEASGNNREKVEKKPNKEGPAKKIEQSVTFLPNKPSTSHASVFVLNTPPPIDPLKMLREELTRTKAERDSARKERDAAVKEAEKLKKEVKELTQELEEEQGIVDMSKLHFLKVFKFYEKLLL
jgi:hypothetical protein